MKTKKRTKKFRKHLDSLMTRAIKRGGHKKVTRPTKRLPYDPKVAKLFFAEMADGRAVLRITRMPGMPSFATIRDWLEESEDFREEYERLRPRFAHRLFEEQKDVADLPLPGEVYIDANGVARTNWECVGRSKLRAEVSQWIMERIAPHLYGKRLELNGRVDIATTFADIARKAEDSDEQERREIL